MLRYLCCDETRRRAVAGRSDINGIDFLDVDTDASGAPVVLVVHFINPPAGLDPTQLGASISGGARITGIVIRSMEVQGATLVVTLDRPGDFSIYRLLLQPTGGPAMDPILGAVDFSFRAGCDTDFDLTIPTPCPPDLPVAPRIDYLARDFNSLRQVLLDRVTALAPGAATAGAPGDPVDLGVTLVELLAYAGDTLSYLQDAIATEATLQTARQRISARRHTRLVDYVMHDGCNARAWLDVSVTAQYTLPAATPVISRTPGLPTLVDPTESVLAQAAREGAQLFETTDAVVLDPVLNAIPFYGWGAGPCCLPKGATSATLRIDMSKALAQPLETPLLAPGRVLLLQEVRGAETGVPADRDPARCWAVRLTSVQASQDPIGLAFDEPPGNGAVIVAEIAWAASDALPFPLTLSASIAGTETTTLVRDIAMARGNIVLVDHGHRVVDEKLTPPAPMASLRALAATRPSGTLTEAPAGGVCAGRSFVDVLPRYRPALANGPVTQAPPRPTAATAAAACLATTPAEAAPAMLGLVGTVDGVATPWTCRHPDLLGIGTQAAYLVETDNAGRATLRFGDDVDGRRPAPSTSFLASYRVGNGAAGNVGAGTLVHLGLPGKPPVAQPSDALLPLASPVANPMPAQGGVDPESIDEVRRSAPYAFRQQKRAVTPQDYADAAETYPGVQRASAKLRWTGSWHTHFVTVQRAGTGSVDDAFLAGLSRQLETIRLSGHDLQLETPVFVSLAVVLQVQVNPYYFRAAVRQDIVAALMGDARPGPFSPKSLSLGQPVYVGPIYATAQGIDGVDAVVVTAFERLNDPDQTSLALGRIDLARNELAQMGNDPDYPDRGVLTLVLEGGR